MAITISGENNNDRILATDGVIDQISGFNIVGVVTATSFTGDLTGNVTGNLTGNVNSTSPLLLQTGGYERLRLTGNNEIGIAGANYGSAGQVLTSGGVGSGVTWSTIPTQATISNNADNRVITGGSGVNLNGEANLTWDGNKIHATATGEIARFQSTNSVSTIRLYSTASGHTEIGHTEDTYISVGGAERLRIKGSNGNVGIGTDNPQCILDISKDVSGGVNFVDIRNHHPSGGAALRVKTQGNYASPTYVGLLGASDSGGSIRVGSVSNHPVEIITNNNAKATMTAGGQLLIGTSSPNTFNGVGQVSNLVVAGATSDTDITDNSGASLTISNTDGTANNTAGLHFAREDTDGAPHYSGASIVAQFLEAMNTGHYPKADLAFLTSSANNNAPTEKLRISSGGTLVIGDSASATPAGQLHLYRASNDPYMYIQRGSGDSVTTIGGIFWRNSGNNLGLVDVQSQDVNDAVMRFYTMGGGNLSERFRLRNNNTGGVALITSPASGDTLNLQTDAGGGQGMIFGTDTSNSHIYLKNNSSGHFGFQYKHGSTTQLEVKSNGAIQQYASGGENQFISKRTGSTYSNGDYYFYLFAKNNGDTNVGSMGIVRDTANDDSRIVFSTATGGTNTERLRITSTGNTRIGVPATVGSSTLIAEKQATIGTKHFYTVYHNFSSTNSPLAVNSKIPHPACGTVEVVAGWSNGNGLRLSKFHWTSSGSTSGCVQIFTTTANRYGVSVSIGTPTMSISGDYTNFSFTFSDSQGSKMEKLKIHFEYFNQFRIDG